jgi:DNA invertase Pin-like site-specific DNA recombinase
VYTSFTGKELYIHAEFDEYGEFMTTEIALLYARVSTQMQASDGMSLDAQERELRAAATFAGYTEMELVREEGRSGKSIKGRPALLGALSRLDNGTASALIVTRVDRLARSTKDFLNIVDRANQKGWRLVMLDLNLDTSTYQGRFVVTIMSALAEMERSIISERQKSVHKYRRETGQNWGVDLGPKSKISDDALKIITELRDKGVSYHEIARELNAQEIPTALGGKWHGSTIHKTLNHLKANTN